MTSASVGEPAVTGCPCPLGGACERLHEPAPAGSLRRGPDTPPPGRRNPVAEVVPRRYHDLVAMNLRLTDDEAEALRRKAEQEGRSMQEVARAAIADYVSERP